MGAPTQPGEGESDWGTAAGRSLRPHGAAGSGCAATAGAASAVGAQGQRALQVEWDLWVLWEQGEEWVQ